MLKPNQSERRIQFTAAVRRVVYADALPSGRPELIVSDIEALTSDAILRLRAWTSRDAGWNRNVLRSEAKTLAQGSSCELTVSRVASESKSWLAWAVVVRSASYVAPYGHHDLEQLLNAM